MRTFRNIVLFVAAIGIGLKPLPAFPSDKLSSFHEDEMNQSKQLNEQALKLFKQGKIQDAISIWEQAAKLAVDPKVHLTSNAEVFNNLGFAYYKLGSAYYARAIENLQRALVIDPNRWTIYLNLGDLYKTMGQRALAIDNYKKVVELNPKYKYANKLKVEITESSSQQMKQQEEMKSYANEKYGFAFRYPRTWELQIQPAPSNSRCEFEIDLRPPWWLYHLKNAEYRRYSDFPLQIFLCQTDYDSFISWHGYYKNGNEWINRSRGLDMEAEEIKGTGWHGIAGEISFKTITRTKEQGPESFLQQAVITNDKGLCVLIIMEYTGAPLYNWNTEDLLNSIEIKPRTKS